MSFCWFCCAVAQILFLFPAIPENLKSQTLQGIVLYIDKFLKSDDPNFIHISLWTLIQLLKGKCLIVPVPLLKNLKNS